MFFVKLEGMSCSECIIFIIPEHAVPYFHDGLAVSMNVQFLCGRMVNSSPLLIRMPNSYTR